MTPKHIDTLLINAHVLTMDQNLTQYPMGAIAIENNQIVAVGLQAEIEKEYIADHIHDCQGMLLMPGLINAHTHVPMTLLRGLADDLRLDVWLMGYMMPVEREFVSPEFVTLGTKLACAEMIRSGITAFADMYYFEDQIAQTTKEIGMRALCAQSITKFPTPDAASYEQSLKYAEEFIKKWKGDSLIIPAIAPHAVYTCTDVIWNEATRIAVENDVPLHTHLAETAQEQENNRREFGMPVVPYIKKQNAFEAKILAAHCVHVDDGEIRTMQHAKAGVAHNPTSNLKLASGIAPVKNMLDMGLNVGIGTDGPASNNDLDMFEEIRLAALLAKVHSNDPTSLPAQQALLMATRMGAEAIHMSDITGSLEPGKRADLILVDLRHTHSLPTYSRDSNSIYAQIVYTGKANDVDSVMINGQWVMQNQKLLTLDEASLFKEAQEYADRIDVFLIKREKSVLSKLIAIGGASEEESFEVQVKIRTTRLKEIEENLLNSDQISIIRRRHYREYDTYFLFEERERLRYREDHFIDEKGDITSVRGRLTHIDGEAERKFSNRVLLSRSRFYAPANHSLRFYQEYFKPVTKQEIIKNRVRYLITFNGTDFFINFDTIEAPKIGSFIEIKSRTWSLSDAENKSKLISALSQTLGISLKDTLLDDYFELMEINTHD